MTIDTSWPNDRTGALAADAVERRVTDGAVRPAVVSQAVPLALWDASVGAFDEICQEQLVAFAASRWPFLTLEPRLFTIDGRTVGGTLVMVRRLPLGVGALAICKWGPMLVDARQLGADRIRKAMIDAILAEFADRRRMLVSILPKAVPDGPNAAQAMLLQRGFRPGTTLPFPARYIVDLSLDDAGHRRALGTKWRYHLGRSEKEGLVFEEAEPARFGEFAALYEAMSARKRFPDYSAFHTVPDLLAIPDPRLRPALFLVRHGGEPVAGAVIFRAGDTASYLYGATDDRALGLRAGYFMHWEIIRWLKRETEARWYDLGGSDGFAGLHQFKKAMVGQAGSIPDLPPMASYAAGRWPFLVGTGALALRDGVQRMKTRIETMRGRLARPDLASE